jgi:hypothetical protein
MIKLIFCGFMLCMLYTCGLDNVLGALDSADVALKSAYRSAVAKSDARRDRPKPITREKRYVDR